MNPSRRRFIVGSAAASGGLALGFNVPFLSSAAAQGASLGGAEVNAWYGILTTGKTPRAIVNRISAELRQVLSDPATRESILKQGINPEPNTAEEFTALIRSDIAKWAKVVREAGIKPE